MPPDNPRSAFAIPAPAFTVLANIKSHGSDWIGTSHEFFDSHGLAVRRYYELEKAGHTVTVRAFCEETDRPHIAKLATAFR